MNPKRPTSAETRQARAFLYKRGARTVPPDEFAGTAKDMALTFAELWAQIWKEKDNDVDGVRSNNPE